MVTMRFPAAQAALAFLYRREGAMSKKCEICGKGPSFGNNISHAHNKTRRKWSANIQRIRIVEPNGRVRRIKICTRCLRSNKVQKAVKAPKAARASS